MYCGFCEEECKAIKSDCGIGTYDYMGTKLNDSQILLVSECCYATIYRDKELTVEYE